MSQLNDTLMIGIGSSAGPLTFVAATTATASGSSVSINKPTGAQAGDLAVMVVSHFGNTPASTGWTQRQNNAGGSINNRTFTRVLDGSEGATFSVTGVSSLDMVAILLYRGGTGAFDIAGGSYTSNSTTPVAPSITANFAGILLAVFAHTSAGTVSTPPSGMTQRVLNAGGGGGGPQAIYELASSPSGASGTKTLVWSNNAGNNAFLMQIY